MGLDLRKLDHLIAVAEEGSFTKAAARLHLSQQALSTSIRTLEREVGVPLLERGPGGVSALPAGHALIDDAAVLNGVARAALNRARRIGRAEPDALRVGHTPAITGDEVATRLRANLGDVDVRTHVHQRYPAQLVEEVLGGTLDVGLCRAIRPPRGLNRSTVTEQRLTLAVDRTHRFADREHVEIGELAEERIMVWGEPGTSGYTDLLLGHCRAAGFEPRYTRNPVQGTPPVTAVIGTGHVAFVTAPPGPAADGRTRVVELRPELYAPLHALWSPHTTSELRDRFLTGEHGPARD